MDYFTINNTEEVKKLMHLAIFSGETLLKNGAEAYRVEDTMERICDSRDNIHNVNSFVTQTGIFLTFEYKNQSYVNFKRVRNVSTNLTKISEVNSFSREFVCKNISLDEGLKIVDEINKIKTYSKLQKAIFGAIAGAFFTLMFGGSFRDFLASYITSFLVISIMNITNDFKLTFFIDNFLGAFLASLFATITLKIGLGENLDMIIIGSIMYLVPGVAITNAVRDTISGDSLSGLSKGMEAIFLALSIAFGVWVVLSIFI